MDKADPQYFSVIDLGTNTFHLLIVKKNGQSFKEVFRERVFVNIAEEGIEHIGKTPFQRGIDTIVKFKGKLDELQISNHKIFGTAALRTADNGGAFVEQVLKDTGLAIELIDGHREAELIAKGTSSIMNMDKGQYLIMDIGGGSVEFILIKDGAIDYINSFPIGVTALYNQFRHQEPISRKEVEDINKYFSKQLVELSDYLQNKNVNALVGASGSFEVLELILNKEVIRDGISEFKVSEISVIMNEIIKMNFEERLQHQRIPNHRAKLIVVAFLLMNYVLSITQFEELVVSPYALKEGVIAEHWNI